MRVLFIRVPYDIGDVKGTLIKKTTPVLLCEWNHEMRVPFFRAVLLCAGSTLQSLFNPPVSSPLASNVGGVLSISGRSLSKTS